MSATGGENDTEIILKNFKINENQAKMKKLNQTTTVIISLIVTIFISGNIFANMDGSSLIAESSYISGKTNTIGFRCDWVTADEEWAYTIGVYYKSNMFVTAGYKGYGNQNLSADKGWFSYNGAVGEVAHSKWDSDENLGDGYGGISDAKSGYFTNDIYIPNSLSGDIVLTYYLNGDGWGGEPHTLTNTLTLKQWFPGVKFNPVLQTASELPGKTVDVSITILNDTGSDDDFNISYDGLWAANGHATSGLLTNNTTLDFTVSITVPTDALVGQVSTTTVTAVGVNDNSFTGTAEIIVAGVWEQEILNETFDTFPPTGWTSYLLGDATNGWGNFNNGNPTPCLRHPTISTLASNWFVSPALNLQFSNGFNAAKFFFDESMWNTSAYSYTGIMISTGDKIPANGDYVEVYEMKPVDEGFYWANHEIDLSNYVGSNPVYIAFLYAGENAHRPYIDNLSLKISKQSVDDAQLVGPNNISIASYENLPTVTGMVSIAEQTGTNGPGQNISGQVGYGYPGTIPGKNWTWINASYAGSNATHDIFVSSSELVTVAGNFDYAYRFRQGEADWVYGDVNGGDYSSANAGELSVSFPTPTAEFMGYEQTLPDNFDNWIYSFKGNASVEVVSADDFIPSVDMELKSVRWKGLYHSDYPRDGSENLFNLFIFENTTINGTNQPGELLFTDFQAGYCSEMLSNNLYLYQLDLTSSFTVMAHTTYWFAVQMELSGDSRWAICGTSDDIIDNKPAAKSDYFFGDSDWHPNFLNDDLGFEIYGEPVPSMAVTPLNQSFTVLKGNTVDVQLTIHNLTGTNDTFNFSYENSLWPVSAPADSGNMNNKDAYPFFVKIPVPVSAIAGQISTTIVTAVGVSDSSYTNSAKIIVKCAQKKDVCLEEFRVWPPEGWVQYKTFGNLAGWIHYNGYGIAHGINPSLCSNWFVSPPLNLDINGADKIFVSFKDATFMHQNYTYTALMVSTGDSDPNNGDFKELFEMTHTVSGVWLERKVDASEYIGSNPVYFAFLYAGANGHQSTVRDFYVYAMSEFIDNSMLEGPDTAAILSYDCLQSVTGSFERIGQSGSNGPAESVVGQFGYGHNGVLPESGQWSWQDGFFDVSSENLDYYMITSAVITAAGKLDYGFRFKQGDSDWIYADCDGSSNGFSSSAAGKLSVAFPKLNGSVTYRQTLRNVPSSAIVSFEDGAKTSVITADDFSPLFDTKIKTLRWKGTYGASYSRDGSEKGFKIRFYENSIVNGTNLPGNILYSEFFDGYASESLSNDLYLYQVDLANQFVAKGGSTYWFAVQNICTNISRWAFAYTSDPNKGNPPAVWSPYFNGHSNWVAGLIPNDYGFEFYAVTPQIILKGKNINITNGDDLPTATDGTDFGQAEFDLEIITNSFTIENSGSTNLTVSNVSLTTGTSAFSIFSLPMSDFIPSTSSTFKIIFDPLESGTVNGTVSIANNDENPFVFAVRGEGIPEPYYLLFIVYQLLFINYRRKLISRK